MGASPRSEAPLGVLVVVAITESADGRPDEVWSVIHTRLAKVHADGRRIITASAPFSIFAKTYIPRGAPSDIGAHVRHALAKLPPVDPVRSALMIGTEHSVIPGAGRAAAMALIRRRSHLSSRQFVHTWQNDHAAFARQINGCSGYRQLHADAALCAAVSKDLGFVADFDGFATVYAPDLSKLSLIRASKEARVDATADEARFIEHSASYFFAAEAAAHQLD